MNIVLSTEQCNKDNIYFTDPIENTVMDDSKFIKLLYSNELITLNGIFIDIKLKILHRENYFKKIKYTFDTEINKEMLQKMYNIEQNILNHYNCNKRKKCIIKDSISSGMMKIFPNTENTNYSSNTFILKISGLWENANEYGVTYKITVN
tara:strand:- start:183 stop:632 length:450 start_codon:yes stop_codon:yes gene_type:complete